MFSHFKACKSIYFFAKMIIKFTYNDKLFSKGVLIFFLIQFYKDSSKRPVTKGI